MTSWLQLMKQIVCFSDDFICFDYLSPTVMWQRWPPLVMDEWFASLRSVDWGSLVHHSPLSLNWPVNAIQSQQSRAIGSHWINEIY